jgi:glycosyltransferase involved in cell wall biosynthesis
MISVITPSKNRLSVLQETIDSVHAQTFDDWELIIVDDGSNDGTAVMVTQRASLDPRIRFIERKGVRGGANTCRNLGVDASDSDLLVFLDSDDLISTDCLANRVSVMQRNPDLDFVVFAGDVFSRSVGDLGRLLDTGPKGNDLDRFLALEIPWQTTGPVWRKSFLLRLSGWDESLLGSQDVDLHIRALSSTPRYWREGSVDHHIRWANDPERISAQKGAVADVVENCGNLAHRWLDILSDTGNLSDERRRLLAGCLFHYAEGLARLRHYGRAVHLWRSAGLMRISGMPLWQGYALLLLRCAIPTGNRLINGLVRRWKYRHGFILPT